MPKATAAHTPVLRYTSGQFVPLPPDQLPECFRPALEPDNEYLDFALGAAGCTCIEQYGTDQGLDIWHHRDGWLVTYWTDARPRCLIYVESVLDFVRLQAEHIAPTACKIMAEHDHFAKLKALRQSIREAA